MLVHSALSYNGRKFILTEEGRFVEELVQVRRFKLEPEESLGQMSTAMMQIGKKKKLSRH